MDVWERKDEIQTRDPMISGECSTATTAANVSDNGRFHEIKTFLPAQRSLATRTQGPLHQLHPDARVPEKPRIQNTHRRKVSLHEGLSS